MVTFAVCFPHRSRRTIAPSRLQWRSLWPPWVLLVSAPSRLQWGSSWPPWVLLTSAPSRGSSWLPWVLLISAPSRLDGVLVGAAPEVCSMAHLHR